MPPPMLEVRGPLHAFRGRKRLLRARPPTVRAVDDVSLVRAAPGETLGIVGESGSGKTTLGRCLLRVYGPDSRRDPLPPRDGSGHRPGRRAEATLRPCRREIRMIFQDPFASLNPRMTVAQIIGEPLLVNGIAEGAALDDRVAGAAGAGRPAGLGASATRTPSPAASASASASPARIALNPRVIVADEATSALDVSLRTQMLDLLLTCRTS